MNFNDNILNEKKSLYLILWTATFIFSIVFFVIGIGNDYLWTNEGFTYAMTNNLIENIVELCHYDYTPPLYYLMIKIYSIVFGNSIIALRVFSMIGTLLLICLSLGPVKRIFGKFGSLIYMLLILILPAFSLSSQSAQMSSWVCFFVTGSTLYGYLAIKDNKVLDWIIFGFLCLASCYIHYYALIAIAFLNIFLFIYLLIKDRKKIIQFSIVFIILFILFSPWIPVLLYQIGQIIKRYWIAKPNLLNIMHALTYQFGDKSGNSINLAGFVLFGILLYYALRLAVFEKSKQTILLLLSIFTYIFTFLFMYYFSKFIKPILHPAYMHSIIGLLVIFAAYTLSRLNEIKTSVIVLTFLIIVTLPANISIRTVRANDPIRQTFVYLSLMMKDDDIILHTDELTASTLTYYFPKNKHFLYLPYHFKGYMNYCVFKKNLTVNYDVRNFLNESKGVWILSKSENFIPFNYYKSIIYNKDYKEILDPEIFKHRNSWMTIKVLRYQKEK